MSFTLDILKEAGVDQAKVERFFASKTLSQLVLNAIEVAFHFARALVEFELKRRAEKPTDWPKCSGCGCGLESKGVLPRSLLTLVGRIHWRRRVGRCPQGCQMGQVVPLDQALEILPKQETTRELKELACLLAVFIPYRISAWIFEKFLGVPLGVSTLWGWVQYFGKSAMIQLEEEIERYEREGTAEQEEIPAPVLQLKCLMGADGVFAPFRPQGGSPQGKTVWKEVKIGVITRLRQRLNRKGKPLMQLVQRRLVAVLGDASLLAKRLTLEGHKQGITQASVVIWISDGGRWLWGIYQTHFAGYVLGILDFYHSAQNLWKGAAAWMDGRTNSAKQWFVSARHHLRHGDSQRVLEDLEQALTQGLNPQQENTVKNVKNYLSTHLQHIQYDQFKQQEIPIGSGFVESACKWLIQQRFKGVGMRWSEDGFSHLLHLRLLWVNQRWEPFFQSSPNG